MPSLTAFLDASVILSGLASPNGGSAFLFVAAKKGKIKLLTTPLVINEVTRHLKKLNLKSSRLKILLDSRIVHLIPNPGLNLIHRCASLTTDPDDAHVLAGTIISSAKFLLSLDKKHLLTAKIRHRLKPIKVFSPREFWQFYHIL